MSKAEIGKIQINYEEYGQGTPLVMVLGLGQDLTTWGFQILEFPKHFRVIVFDNRDAGRSSRCTGSYDTEAMADDVLGLMDHLEIERAHVLGTSMGGMIAQQIALLAPERVISLILASTTSWGEG
jgi:pimeloyl-ACP methyl ester carboxylesterase